MPLFFSFASRLNFLCLSATCRTVRRVSADKVKLPLRIIPGAPNVIFILFLLFLSPIFCCSQDTITPSLQVTFGSKLHTNRDILHSCLKARNNQLYVIGTSEDDETFNDIFIFKLQPDLTEIWRKKISFDTHFSFDRVVKAFLDPNDNLILIGKSAYNAYAEFPIILKFDPDGNEIWRLPLGSEKESSRMSGDKFTAEMDQEGVLTIGYLPEQVANSSVQMRFLTVSADGTIETEYFRNELYGEELYPKGNIEVYEGNFYGVVRERVEAPLNVQFSYIRFNGEQYHKKVLPFSLEQIHLIARAEYSEMLFDPSGNPVWVVYHYFTFNAITYRGASIFFLDKDGNIRQQQNVRTDLENYVIGSTFTQDGSMYLLGNARGAGSAEPLALTMLKYDPDGNFISAQAIPGELGILGEFSDDYFGVYTESNRLLKLDYQLSQLDVAQLNPVNAFRFSPGAILFANEDMYLAGTEESSLYEGSDFLAQRDISLKRASAGMEAGHFLYSGEGTSKAYKTKSIQPTGDGNYLVAITEKAGPDNLQIGGSRGPEVSHLLTYSHDLTLTDQKTGVNNELWSPLPGDRVSFDFGGAIHEYLYNYDTDIFTLSRDGIVIWTREWDEGSDNTPSGFVVDTEGSLIFRTTRYGTHLPALNKITLENVLTRADVEKNPERLEVLDNKWIFTANSSSVIVYSSDLEKINETPIPNGTSYSNSNYAAIHQKNNKVVIHTVNENRLRIYSHFGELIGDYYLFGDLREPYAFFEGDDLMVLARTGKYIVREVSWLRATISRYENFVTTYLDDIGDMDSDMDGVTDLYDRCPGTPLGNPVNEFGCNLISVPGNNFRVTTYASPCPENSTGSVEITAQLSMNYTATLSAAGADNKIQEFTEKTIFEALDPGTYKLCLKVDGMLEYEQCHDLLITSPEKLFVHSKIDPASKNIELELGGGSSYTITLNGNRIVTDLSNITLQLDRGDNDLHITTGTECQGIYYQNIRLESQPIIYPNPVSDGYLMVDLGAPDALTVESTLYDLKGQIISTGTHRPQNGIFKWACDELAHGTYLLKIAAGNKAFTYRIIIQ